MYEVYYIYTVQLLYRLLLIEVALAKSQLMSLFFSAFWMWECVPQMRSELLLYGNCYLGDLYQSCLVITRPLHVWDMPLL